MEKKQHLKIRFIRVFMLPLFLGIFISVFFTIFILYVYSFENISDPDNTKFFREIEDKMNKPLIYSSSLSLVEKLQQPVNALMQIRSYFHYLTNEVKLDYSNLSSIIDTNINAGDLDNINFNDIITSKGIPINGNN